MKKLIISLLITLQLLNVPAYASNSFTDMNAENKYYNSVMELVNTNVISGYADNTFKPDNYITVCEALTIVEKVFGDVNNLPQWSKWKELTDTGRIYQTNWDLEYRLFMNDYFGAVTFELGSHFVLNINNIKLLDSNMYGYSNDDLYFSNVKLRGFNTDKKSYDMMTRAEFADLVVWAKNNINTTPSYSVKFPVKYSYLGYSLKQDEKLAFESSVLGSFLEAPEWLLNYYSQKGGSIKIVEESKWYQVYGKDVDAVYVHGYNNPVIYVQRISPSIAIHELGHFVWYTEGLNLSNDIYNKEKESIMNISLSDYCTTSISEYFAEAFQVYFLHPKRMSEEAPDTYKFIDDIVTKLDAKY